MRSLLWAATLMGLANGAQAQNVRNIDQAASGATITVSNQGVYKSCGLRFVGIDLDARRPIFPAYGFDFNLVVTRFDEKRSAALLKTQITRLVDIAEVRAASGKLVKLNSTWVQVEGIEPLKAAKTGIPGENGLSSMSVYGNVMGALEALVAIATGEKQRVLLLGAQVAGESAVRIYRITPQVEKKDGDAFLVCAAALGDQWQKDLATLTK